MRIFYDSITSNEYSITKLRNEFELSVRKITMKYGVQFNLTTILYSEALDLDPSCSALSLDDNCSTDCGTLENCANLHHRSAERLCGLLTSPDYYTFRIVGYSICYYDNDYHRNVGGLGALNGKDAVATISGSFDLNVTIQHELTHSLGATHDNCKGGMEQACVLIGDFDHWCSVCKNAILSNLEV